MNIVKRIVHRLGPPAGMIRWSMGLLAVLVAGCGVYSETLASLPTPMAPTPTPALSAGTSSLAQSAAASQPHPTDPYFALDHVLDIAIEIAPADWDALRYQTRTFEDVIAEIQTGCLAQPFTDIYSWFPAQVTVDSETHSDVGIRKKGFLGSLSTEKPSLKLRFDKYVDGQSLGNAMERMTLNNGIQDDSLINTCLAYQIFADAGLPAPRCNFATVSVNGQDMGLYIHVEEIKPPFLERHFADPGGNLYEGTVSDFRPGWRGTFEKKTNEDAADWSDIDGVVAALQDPTPAGLETLGTIVDLDRFLSFWAMEVLISHWDGYVSNRNNYHFYREPDGLIEFIPWGVDQVFSLEKDPNPFDDLSEPPSSVLAHGAIAHRLYQDEAGRARYVSRLRELLTVVWQEEELLQRADDMAAIVQQHALPAARADAAEDTERVRQFIRERRRAILEDLEPDPPDWPWPMAPAPCLDGVGVATDEVELGEVELHFATTWGSNQGADPFGEGTVTHFLLNGAKQPPTDWAVIAGAATPEEAAEFGMEDAAHLIIMRLGPAGSVEGLSFFLPKALLSSGVTLSFDAGEFDAGYWSLPLGATVPDWFSPITEGRLELIEVGTAPGAAISARFYGHIGDGTALSSAEPEAAAAIDIGLVINEIAAQGEPWDWLELYNASDSYLALANFVLADDLTDASQRVPFPSDLVLPPGAYLQIALDKDGWPGFALGRDEELGIWTTEGTLVDSVDWNEGQADAGTSFARMPDGTGDFQTVSSPTPGARN